MAQALYPDNLGETEEKIGDRNMPQMPWCHAVNELRVSQQQGGRKTITNPFQAANRGMERWWEHPTKVRVLPCFQFCSKQVRSNWRQSIRVVSASISIITAITPGTTTLSIYTDLGQV